MHERNFKLGWYIPQKIAALSHLNSEMTKSDFMDVINIGNDLLSNNKEFFHIIIDNRLVKLSAPIPLTQMQEKAPYMNHPMLRWVVVVKPESLTLATNKLAIEKSGNIQLINVSNLQEAFDHIKRAVDDIDWSKADVNFFPT